MVGRHSEIYIRFSTIYYARYFQNDELAIECIPHDRDGSDDDESDSEDDSNSEHKSRSEGDFGEDDND